MRFRQITESNQSRRKPQAIESGYSKRVQLINLYCRLALLAAFMLISISSSAQTVSDVEMQVVVPPPVALPGQLNHFTVRFTNHGPESDSVSYSAVLGPRDEVPIRFVSSSVMGDCRILTIVIEAPGEPLSARLGSPFLAQGESGECTIAYETSSLVRIRSFQTTWNLNLINIADPNSNNNSATMLFGFRPALGIPATSNSALVLLIIGVIGGAVRLLTKQSTSR